jgi:hypothetical protein
MESFQLSRRRGAHGRNLFRSGPTAERKLHFAAALTLCLQSSILAQLGAQSAASLIQRRLDSAKNQETQTLRLDVCPRD